MTLRTEVDPILDKYDAQIVSLNAQIAALKAQLNPVPPPSSLTPTTAPGTPVAAKAWKSVFSDEFSATAIDATKWNTGRFAATTTADNPYNGANEGAALASSQVSLVGGQCVLTMKKLAAPITLPPNGTSYSYISGEINTIGHYAFVPGHYFEANIKVPTGDGLWPAMWFCAVNGAWPPEFDGFEFFNTLTSKKPMFNVHYAGNPNTQLSGGPQAYGSASSYLDAFHVYGVLWSADGKTLTPYIDGVPGASYAAGTTTPMYPIINLDSYAGHSPASGVHMDIDWVRAWV